MNVPHCFLDLKLSNKKTSYLNRKLKSWTFTGRYEEQFIEHRRQQLQLFVDCVCLHPVLSQSAVWKHFIECTDEKMWKAGKRRAEKDALVGANYFACLQVPEKVIDPFDL